ncbi:MAG: transglycosylase domain-containing protein [Alistipes sp.]|nr:transglycosylase domain-containing protein [Alistipes sp.]
MAKKKQQKRWWKRIGWQHWTAIALWGITLSAIIVVATIFLMAKNEKFGTMPSFDDLENPKTNLATQIYSADGKVIGTYFVENRTSLSYEELFPEDRSLWLTIDGHKLPPIVAALLATEDIRFFDHAGIDMQATARVGIKTILMGQGEQGGGSTITQQLAKNLYKTRRNKSGQGKVGTIAAKAMEYVIATQLEYNYTKEEIVAMYLNTVEFSNSNFGIKSAANNFFNCEPRDLSIEEAALIAGQVKAPSTYAIVRNGKANEKARERRNIVLKRMAAAGAISGTMADSLSQLPIDISNYRRAADSHNVGSATYFREMVRRTMMAEKPKEPNRSNYSTKLAYTAAMWEYQLALKEYNDNPIIGWCHKNFKDEQKGETYDIYRDGLKIYTTLDSRMQQYAEEATREHMEEVVQPQFNRQVKSLGSPYIDITQEQIDRKIYDAMRYSDRWYRMAENGHSEKEILASFDTPMHMQVFTYSGVRDTIITPRDSIIHHKSIMRSAFVAIDPHTGYVRAYVGGPDYRFFKFDGARQGKRQVGSTAKPFIYTFAIDHLKLDPCHPVPNVPVSIETVAGIWSPKEASEVEYVGTHPLYWGLAKSRNNYSAWIMKEAGNPQLVADFIHRIGIKGYIDPVVSLCLGSYESNPYEMTSAYCTFSNKGVRVDPIFVTRIEDSNGNLLYEFHPKTESVISEDIAYKMIQMMRKVVSDGTARRMLYEFKFNNVDIAAKTGTTNDNIDTWFMCATPNLVMGSWVGGEEGNIHFSRNADGSRMALPITGKFLTKVYQDGSLGVHSSDIFTPSPNATPIDCPMDLEDGGSRSTTDLEDDLFDIY